MKLHVAGPHLGWRDRRHVTRVFGISVPSESLESWFALWQPSPDLALHDAYLRLTIEHSKYLDLVRDRGLATFESTGPNGLLPTGWKQSDEIAPLPWWDPTTSTPPDAASGTVGLYGWILMKHENGHAYVLLTDSGHRSG
jgi:hypothetical protein